MKEKGLVHGSVDALFADFREKEIKAFGANWATAIRWGDDKHYLKSMEINWKWHAYLRLKGRPPSFSQYSYRHSYRH